MGGVGTGERVGDKRFKAQLLNQVLDSIRWLVMMHLLLLLLVALIAVKFLSLQIVHLLVQRRRLTESAQLLEKEQLLTYAISNIPTIFRKGSKVICSM